ncbi:MAG: hypothetical protein IT480_12775 [Gammaproteobacteria bacterium]|nr:hypothetical protein [Gammaproteobacteria bacterium]
MIGIEDEVMRLRGEHAVLMELLGSAADVLRNIDPDDSDEAERLHKLLGAIERAQSRRGGSLL